VRLPLPLPLILTLSTAWSTAYRAQPIAQPVTARLHGCTAADKAPAPLYRYTAEMRGVSTKPWEGQDLHAFGKLGDGDTSVAVDSQMHHVSIRLPSGRHTASSTRRPPYP
jgi:hypothetical protein